MRESTHVLRETICLYLSVGTILLFLGTLTLDYSLAVAGLLPLCMLVAGALMGEPEAHVSIEAPEKLVVGDKAELRVKIAALSGLGPFLVIIMLPPCFKTEQGGRRLLAWGCKLLTPYLCEHIIKVTACRSGRYSHVTVRAYLFNPLMIRYRETTLTVKIDVEIKPRLCHRGSINVRARGVSLGVTGAAKSIFGPPSLDFREIRRYVPGDPPRLINWKVTARLGSEWPYVNEMEREAVSRVLILPLFNLDLEADGEPVGETALSLLLSISLILCREGHIVYTITRSGEARRLRRIDKLEEISETLREVSHLAEQDPPTLRTLLEKIILERRPDIAVITTYVRDERDLQTLDMVVRVLRRASQRVKTVLVDLSHVPENLGEETKLMYIAVKRRLLRKIRQPHMMLIEIHDAALHKVPTYVSMIRDVVKRR